MKKNQLKINRLYTILGGRYLEGDENPPTNPPADPPKTFSQDEVNEIVKKRVSKLTTEKQTVIAELETLRQSNNLSKEERETLAKRIEELETSMMTDQERAAKEKAKLERESNEKIKTIQAESESWRGRYERSMIERALVDAAIETNALSSEQIRMMFGGTTKLIQDKGEDGSLLDSFTPMLEFTGLSQDKKTKEVISLPVGKALAKIKEDGLHANLFKHDSRPGTGAPPSQNGGGRGKDDRIPPQPEDYSSPEEYGRDYQEWRSKHNLDGSLINGQRS